MTLAAADTRFRGRDANASFVARLAALALAGLLGLALVPVHAAEGGGTVEDWIAIDYAALVDRRQLSHSGEPVGLLLDRLGGRPLPAPGQRPDDRALHRLLDPLLESYAFVLQDALDSLEPVADPPRFDVGSLWPPGASQPAWVELFRARRYLAESDGTGRLRLCLPWTAVAAGEAAGIIPALGSTDAAQAAFEEAWPVVRHLIAAEQRRLGPRGNEARTLQLEVHAYVHHPARTTFVLGSVPHTIEIQDTRPRGTRPPLDLDEIQAFLDQELRLEGGRLEPDGTLRLLGSRVASRPGILGRELTLADFAVAYRAVSRGGLAEPYMSLDRGYAPQTSLVNYGGRLRDTSLGLVSLLCDIRFKTFSLGLDILRAQDVRDEVRQGVPSFRTHYERFAADPQSRNVMTQQTRLWFYPDDVDLTVSLQGDLLAMRRVRMTAASERVELGTTTTSAATDPPWTSETVAAINAHYADFFPQFPELADLDQVVRLLAFFTWLRQAEAQGLRVPELDQLLALELPQIPTPRTFPQLLSYNVLPTTADSGAVDVFDRLPIGAALDRLNTDEGRPLPARRRFARAVSALDPADSRNAAFFGELRRYDLATLDELRLDLLAYRAERLRMHQLVLATLDPVHREHVAGRERSGDRIRALSIGIGGLELGMGRALSRAGARNLELETGQVALYASTELSRDARSRSDAEPPGGDLSQTTAREAWRVDPASSPPAALPDHGLKRGVRGRIRTGRIVFQRSHTDGVQRFRIIYGVDSVDVRSLMIVLDDAERGTAFERVEDSRFLSYRLERSATGFTARAIPLAAEQPGADPAPASLPLGLALMQFGAPESPAAGAPAESSVLPVRLTVSHGGLARQLEADFPRSVLSRLVLGPQADPAGGVGLPGISPPPPVLAAADTVMLLMHPQLSRPPWDGGAPPRPGEEDPIRIARTLGQWWRTAADAEQAMAPAVVVGVDGDNSLTRWAQAPQAGASTLLLLPEGAFCGVAEGYRDRLAEAWDGGPVTSTLPESVDADLVLLVSGEPPGLFAERLRRLAQDPKLKGKALAAWGLLAPIRRDLPAALLAEGNLNALGLAPPTVLGMRTAVGHLAAMRAHLRGDADARQRLELLPGPFLWFF